MANELILRSKDTAIRSRKPMVRQLWTQPFERIRVLATCPANVYSAVRVLISHIEDEASVGLLDKFVVEPGTGINRTYEVPGVMVSFSAAPTAGSDTGLDVWVWGYRSDQGSSPAVAPIEVPAASRVLADW